MAAAGRFMVVEPTGFFGLAFEAAFAFGLAFGFGFPLALALGVEPLLSLSFSRKTSAILSTPDSLFPSALGTFTSASAACAGGCNC